MGASSLSSRAIIGAFYNRLEQDLGNSWIGAISNYFESNQESERYNWLGMSPAMREWIGGRQAKGLRESGLTIRNVLYEATLEIGLDDLRRDKTGQILVRVDEMADRANAHWAKLLSSLLTAGETTVCYDGQYFFDTDHAEGDSGTQSNDLAVSGLSHATNPTGGDMENVFLALIQAILGFKDDQGEPMNENAREFLAVVPVPLLKAAAAAIGSEIIVSGSTSRTNALLTLGSVGGFTVSLATNARLPWTSKVAMFRTDAPMKALIRQEEEGIQVAAVAEGSELEFKERKHHYGISALRAVGYGYWQRAALATLST